MIHLIINFTSDNYLFSKEEKEKRHIGTNSIACQKNFNFEKETHVILLLNK